MNQRKDKAIVAGVIITTVLMLSVAFMPLEGNNALATKYEKSQAASQANSCGNGDSPFDIFCQNIVSQLEGDGNAINIIALQPSHNHLRLLP